MKKLNLGCGTDIKEDWVNLDIIDLPGIDVVFDINITPYPFEDETFDEVLCKDILEHVDFIKVLKELHRITKKGGKIHIQVPHFSSINNYLDPTHKNKFSVDTFDFFIKSHERSYYFDFSFSKILSKKISFIYYFKVLGPVINLSPSFQKIYERFGFCNFWVAHNINITFER